MYKKKESSNITHVQYISDTHAVRVCDFTQFNGCVSLCFQNICYALRFCLRVTQYPANVSQMKEVFSCSKNDRKKKNQSFCHFAWPLRSERLSGKVCMESFAWVVFLFFTWHQCLIIVLFVVRIQYDVCLIIVVLFYCSTMHNVMGRG